MSNISYVKKQATYAAKSDYLRGLDADSERHNAKKGSAWSDYYNRGYESIVKAKALETGIEQIEAEQRMTIVSQFIDYC